MMKMLVGIILLGIAQTGLGKSLSVDQLIQQAGDKNPYHRMNAAKELDAYGGNEQVARVLAELLNDPFIPVVKQAAYDLRNSTDGAVLVRLKQLAEAEDPGLRAWSSWILRQKDSQYAALNVAALKGLSADGRKAWAAQVGTVRPVPAEMGKLVELMTDSDYSVAAQAVESVGKSAEASLTGAVLETLVVWNKRTKDKALRTECMKDEHPGEVVGRLAGILGAFRKEAAVSALVEAMDNPCKIGRIGAVGALAKIRDPATIDALIIKKNDPDQDVRVAVLNALNQYRDEKAKMAVETAQADSDPGTAGQVILIKMREKGSVEKAPELFLQGLKSVREDVRAYAYAKFGESADVRYLPSVIEAFQREGSQRGTVSGGESLLHFDDDRAFNAVGALLLKTTEPYAISKLADAVGKAADPRRTELMRKLLFDSGITEEKLDSMICSFGGNSRPVPVDLYLPFASHTNSSIRRAVLFEISKSMDPRVPAIIREMVQTEDGFLLQCAISRLSACPGPENKDLLLAVLDRSADPKVQKGAMQQLVAFGADPRVSQWAQTLMTSTNSDIRKSALPVWRGSHPLALSTEELEAKVDDPDPLFAEEAFLALIKRKGDQAAACCVKFLKNGKTGVVRFAAAKAMSVYRDPDVIECLIEVGLKDSDPALRRTALSSLKLACSSDPEALAEVMSKALKDSELQVRKEAWWTLEILYNNAQRKESNTPFALKLKDLMKDGMPK